MKNRENIYPNYIRCILLIIVFFITIATKCLSINPQSSCKIAFMSNRNVNPEIFIMNSDGSGLKQISHFNGNPEPDNISFSPDGSKIIFNSIVFSDQNIYVINVDGSGQKRLTFNSSNDKHPCFAGKPR